MAKLLQKLLLFLPVLALVVGVNYFIDNANIFRSSRYEEGIAQILLRNNHVANLINYDERALQRFYINGISKAKDIVVLGSSRSMGISRDLFVGKDFFNNSVSGATIQDHMAIYQLYRARAMLPEVVIIGLDPWLLNKHNDQIRWKSLWEEYYQLRKVVLPEKHVFRFNGFLFQKYAELVSFSYFQESVRSIMHKLSSSKKDKVDQDYCAVSEVDGDNLMKLSDGSLRYDKKRRDASSQEVHKLAVSYVFAEQVYSLGQFYELDADLINLFERFIDLVIKDKVKVVFFLPSYHPAVYEILCASEKYKNVVNAQEYFTAFAKKKGIRVLGSYDPGVCLLSGSDFYDGMHMKQEVYQKVIGRLF